MVWHVRVQAISSVVWVTGLSLVLTEAGGLSEAFPEWGRAAIINFGWPMLIVGLAVSILLFVYDLGANRTRAISLRYEPRQPWRREIAQSRFPHPVTGHDVIAPTRWFRIEVVAPHRNVAHGCRVYLRKLERLAFDGKYRDTGYDGDRQLRWSKESEAPFAPRDVGAQRTYADVISLDPVYNVVAIKWHHVQWAADVGLFNTNAVYRLTISADTHEGSIAIKRLILLWPGKWDLAEVYSESKMPVKSARERFDKLLHIMATVPPEALSGVTVPSETPAEEYPASDAEPDAYCGDTQTPKDTSEDAEG